MQRAMSYLGGSALLPDQLAYIYTPCQGLHDLATSRKTTRGPQSVVMKQFSRALTTIATSLLLLLQLFAQLPITFAKTALNGDIVDGVPVITFLDLTDVPSNAITRYQFLAGEAQGAIKYYIPVFVARGNNESLATGRRLSLSSTVHGDEYSGVRVVQNVFAQLEDVVKAGKFNGTVIGIPTINVNGIMHNQRNRTDPNNSTAAPSNPQGYAYRIWHDLWGNTTNVDIAVDLHTLTTGSNGPMWVYSDYRLPYNARLAQLVQPDIIKIDGGEPGSIETSFVQNRIPAITLELGPPSVWNKSFISRATDFIFRLLTDLRMTTTTTAKGGEDGNNTNNDNDKKKRNPRSKTYVSTNRINVPATKAGWAEAHVDVLEDVRQGQEVVTVYDSWGGLVEKVKAPAAGRVLQVRTDPAVEGGTIVLVLVNNGTTTITT